MRTDFHADLVDEVLGRLVGAFTGNQDVERVHAAVVLAAAGDVSVLRAQVRALRVDWRDVLPNGGLGHGDWPEVLDRECGPVSRPCAGS
ncbi:hypothetical protein SK571_35245 [Lentzea sp. BCCO 10_0798]|uniref:Uncharacterized protein n=1 Tax=Lentzea kristufekii TaxID=3095430 RepID=A0ABU4U262_9PSEU|nr:hypothetical protein [Lentzea sp. BCCO 10_0798]MDX8054654.1 hypothetical protein [Lentzea sp. BCCO 10_0798]